MGFLTEDGRVKDPEKFYELLKILRNNALGIADVAETFLGIQPKTSQIRKAYKQLRSNKDLEDLSKVFNELLSSHN